MATWEQLSEAIRDTIATGLEGFGSDSIATRGDYSIFNEAHKWYVVIDYGGTRQERSSLGGGYWRITTFQLVYGVGYQDDVQVHEDLDQLREHIQDRMGINPGLAPNLAAVPPVDLVYNAEVTEGIDIPEIVDFGAQNMQFEGLVVEVTESLEYAEVT